MLSGIGMGLVVLGGLAFNLVPLVPARPARRAICGRPQVIVVIVFLVILALALGFGLALRRSTSRHSGASPVPSSGSFSPSSSFDTHQ